MAPSEINRDYRAVHALYEQASEADSKHDCPSDDDFVVCDLCRLSREAMQALEFRTFSTIMPLVEAQHALLEELVRQVVQGVPFHERSPALQRAMLAGFDAIGGLNGE